MKWIGLFVFVAMAGSMAIADGQTEAGLTLLEAPAARPAALGEAFTAAPDDVSAFIYNPATLGMLNRGHASFLFQRGLYDDSYGQFIFGQPLKGFGFGLSVGYYDGGSFLFSEGKTTRMVNAQRDIALNLGLAKRLGPVNLGVATKYFSSELAETDKATSVAFDLGAAINMFEQSHFGVSLQNIGGSLKYDQYDNDLPRVFRAGYVTSVSFLAIPINVFVDSSYFLNLQEWRPGVGLEAVLGILALRSGFQRGEDLEEINFGTGFNFGALSMDYAFGLVNQVESKHRVSLGVRFGRSKTDIEIASEDKKIPSNVEINQKGDNFNWEESPR
jgi:hypothetical protein